VQGREKEEKKTEKKKKKRGEGFVEVFS